MAPTAPRPKQRAISRVEALARRVEVFRRLEGAEQRLFIAAALKPYPVRLKDMLSTLRRLDLLQQNGRKVTDAQFERWLEGWRQAKLVDYDGKTFECNEDLGTYVCRKAAETSLGEFLRQCPGLEREIWRDVRGGDAVTYWVRVSRFVRNLDQTDYLVREWLLHSAQDDRIAALFGPADPFYLPKVLPDWATLLPKISYAAAQRLQDTAWYVEFYDALLSNDRDAGKELLLVEDRGRLSELVKLAEDSGLAKSPDYLRLDLCARLLSGQHAEVRRSASRPEQSRNPVAHSALAILELCEGNVASGLERFQSAHQFDKSKGLDETTRSWFGVFELLALLIRGDSISLARAGSILSKLLGNTAKKYDVDDRGALLRLGFYYEFLTKQTLVVTRFASLPQETPLSVWIGAMTMIWMDAPTQGKPAWIASCRAMLKVAERNHSDWFVAEMVAVLRRFEDKSERDRAEPQARRLVDLVEVKAPWELMLESLARFAGGNEKSSIRPERTEPSTRIAWFVQLYGEHLQLEPRLQTKKGDDFSRGRPIALQRFSPPVDETLPLSAADRKIAAHIVAYSAYYGATEYRFDEGTALELVGHPYVFDQEDESLHYDVKRGQVWLRCEQNDAGNTILRLDPPVATALHQLGKLAESIVRRHGSELIIFELTKELKGLAGLLGQQCLLPKEAAVKLAALLPALAAHVPTSGNLLGGTGDHYEPSDALPVLRIKPRPGALRVQLLVTPFGPGGPSETPGEGSELLADYTDGQARQLRRNLQEERSRAEQLLTELPELNLGLDSFVWKIEGIEACLELIAALSRLDERFVRIEWPEGQPFKLKQVREMKVNITGGDASRWFELEGQLQLSDDSLLTVAELMTRLKQREGRFIQLKSGDYTELSEDALAKLQLLEAFRVKPDSGEDEAPVQVVPWLAFALPEDGDLFSPQASHVAWQAWRKRVAHVSGKQAALPKGFQGELRDYQLEGYHWLCRMAELCLGVCLADDMGLGKTVQALALLEHRSTRKLPSKQDARPILIVAPASVCPNWLAEGERFTEHLEFRWHTGAERSLEGLNRKTVVVCTYDVLYRDHAEFTKIVWDTVILDEAQQIKNAHTHRAKTAFALKAQFRLAMSGTPIENHLGELWSLYRFLMPGLLGDQHEFVERYRNPIENLKDDERRKQLQTLIRPFILRRTKQQVLSELPSRTELVRKIPLSAPELALYEAIRLRGLESLKTPVKDKNQQRVRVLAELMRLRRACCHPRLVLEDSEVSSSKLATLLELVTELRDAGHRALVFSQFVDHLALVREALDDEGVSYQYLDGATPMAERAKRVQAFQQGEGELFLISLRAGGTGLNLTAADYVLHLDPWWNPAVEDQASDRAHRIGQERPVTIYRLVAEGTIEEKLVLMHGQKRALAADILADTGEKKRFDPDALMELLRESAVSSGVTKAKPAERRRGKSE